MDNLMHIVCPQCDAVNRLPQARLVENPTCGKCGQPLFNAHPVALTQQTFAKAITRNDIPVLVDFWAPWCGPCRRVAPELDAVAEELGAQVVIAKVNVDDESDLAVTYGIQSIPAMVIFKGGKEVDRLVGAYPRTAISAKLKAQI